MHTCTCVEMTHIPILGLGAFHSAHLAQFSLRPEIARIRHMP